MTDINRGLFVPLNGAVGTTSIQARLALAGLLAENAPGVPRDGLLVPSTATIVTGNGSTMSYDIPAINVVKNRTAGEGPYMFSSSGTTNTPTTAAPGSNSRIDLIWVKQNDVAKGDADNKAITGVTQGTAAASPTAPYGSVPAGAYVLAEATVASTATKGSDASIVQVWRYTAPRGVPIPVRNSTERGEITPNVGTEVKRLDSFNGRTIEWWNGTIWKLPFDALGIVAYNEMAANSGALTSIAVCTYIASFTFKAGRRYRVVAGGGGFVTDTTSTFSAAIQTCSTADSSSAVTGLTQIKARNFRDDTANEGREVFSMQKENFTFGSDTTLQVKLTVGRLNGAGTFTAASDSTNRVCLSIEDLGEAF